MTTTDQQVATVQVDLGQRTVTVPQGGLYDRFRMNTNLDDVARDPRVPGVEFFRSLSKTKVDSPIGPTYTPNFYYRMSSARLTLLARSSAIRNRLPQELEPVELAPGIGLASAIFFRYDVADIDFYTEAAVGVAVRPARHGPLGFLDLVTDLKNDHLHTYVFALPVNTQIAQVRGHDGYGFPKWLTDLDVEIDSRTSTGRVANDSGGVDVAFEAPTPTQTRFAPGKKVSSLTSYTQVDGRWLSTLNQTHLLAAGTATLPRHYSLELGDGRMADDLRALKPIRALRLDVATVAQAALHMPVPISVEAN